MDLLAAYATILHPADSVAVVKRRIPTGTSVEGPEGILQIAQEIPPGHKIAVRAVAAGQPVLKYGQFIGWASAVIRPGEHVHSHNLIAGELPRSEGAPDSNRSSTESETIRNFAAETNLRTFSGYPRPNGKIGTRNYIGVISSVNCSASVSRYIAERFRGPELTARFPNVDGVVAFTHKSGCAMDPGAPSELLQRVLAGMARHPNIGGYLLIGLGCEVNQISHLMSHPRMTPPSPIEHRPTLLNIQQAGGVRKTVEAGIAAVEKLLPSVNAHRRSPQPLSGLVLALNCGGSDGHSGCTANPALGVASDRLVAAGGTSVLAETPEIYGAEHLLAARAVSPALREKLLEQVRWWERHAVLHGVSIDNNPSFGNRQGGLTTIYEKSLGAIAKGGLAPLRAVYGYAEEIQTRGFGFMDTPGYDPVSMTGLVAGGCNVAVFTTGRGSVYGCKPTPCLKVASHSALYRHLEEDMDINAGTILDGTGTLESVGEEIFEKIIAVASGELTKSERSGLGDEEFAPWILGPTL